MIRSARTGLTLVELVVAIALLALLIGLGVPSFTAWIRNSQVRAVADSLSSGLRLAQNEAVRLNRSVVFSLTNAQPGLNSVAAANGKNWSVQTIAQFGDDTSKLFVQGGALAEVASGATITSAVATVCFNSTGRLTSKPASGTGATGVGTACTINDTYFEIDAPGSDRTLRVYLGLAGQVHMSDPKRPALSAASPDGCP